MNPEYEIEEPRKGFKKIIQLIAALLIVAILLAVVYYLTKVNQAASSQSREVSFTIEKGAGSKQIAEKLSSEKIISSSWVFVVYTTLHGAGGKIQAGEYRLNANMSIAEIVDVLTAGKVVSSDKTITLIEGWSNNQIAAYLKNRDVIKTPNEFDQVLSEQYDFKFNDLGRDFSYQGFLFPDTYKLGRTESVENLVQKMLKNFESKFTDSMINDLESSGKKLSDVIILASIIEKEVGRNKEMVTDEDLAAMQKERELVASVFYNRLSINMALESDATVNYITGKSDRQPLISDTKIKSAYNTYQNRGLPPAPISNPGIGAIKAALYPADSNYLYFINKSDGEAVFAKTLAEHNENKAKYLK